MMSRKIALAKHVATVAHAGQRRKWTNEPYIEHPMRVAELVRTTQTTSHYVSDDMICAALLHDVVEDTALNMDAVEIVFGGRVAGYVSALTNVKGDWIGNRATRKVIEVIRLSQACPEVQTIKLADLIDNTADIVKWDEKFAIVYMAEKKALLEVLVKGNPILYNKASKQIEDYYSRQSAQDQCS